MTPLVARLQRYLAGVVPLAGELVPHPARDRLPLAFQHPEPVLGIIGTRPLTFLLIPIGDPAAAARAAIAIATALGTTDVVLVVDTLTAAQRRGLIAAGIPFVVPDAHLWLPMLGMQFTERASVPAPREHLAPATQALLLHWLTTAWPPAPRSSAPRPRSTRRP